MVLSDSCPIFRPEAEAHLQSLLFTVIIRRRHILARPEPSRLKELLPKYLWDLYGDYLVQAPKQIINSYQRWVHSADCSTCDAAKLAHFCELPTVLIVENTESDGGWLKLVIHKLRPRISRHLAGPHFALEIRQAGGIGEIPKELERTTRRYQQARPGETFPLRVIALADSDAKKPGNPSPDARQVLKSAESLGACAHILAKRTIENYIPDNSLYDYAYRHPDRRIAIEFVTALNGPARDHYPLKTGLTEEEIAATGSMYPSDASLGLKVGDFIIDFLSNFGPRVDGNELKRRDGMDELDKILDLIEENL